VTPRPRDPASTGNQFGSNTEHPALILSVRVVPQASRSEIVGFEGEILKVRVAAPPVKGKANKELIKLLAGTLGVRNDQLEIISGTRARRKRVRVDGVDGQAVLALLQAKAPSP
jgi:uncharacterized protein (TIGR00251 family)